MSMMVEQSLFCTDFRTDAFLLKTPIVSFQEAASKRLYSHFFGYPSCHSQYL